MPDTYANPVTDPLGGLQQLMLQRMERGLNQQQEQVNKLQQMSQRNEDTESAERWGAMARAAASVPPMVGGFGQLLASIGGAYGQTIAAQNQRAIENQQALTKMVDAGAGGAGAITQMMHAALNPIQNIGGVGISRLGGQTVVPKDFTKDAMQYFMSMEKRLQESGDPNATQNAMAATQQRFGEILSNAPIAGSTYAQRPGAAPMATQGGPQVVTAPAGGAAQEGISKTPLIELAPVGTELPEGTVTLDSPSWVARLKKERDALPLDDNRRAKLNDAIIALKSEQPAPIPAIPKVMSKPEMERSVTTEKEAAKDWVDYEKNLVERNDSNNAMLRNLGYIKEQSKNANFGAGAEFKTQALKWADTMGVSLSDDEKKAMNANQIIGKVALQLATIGAKNISSRPTQLEFEKLLNQGVPAAGMTKDAFLKVLDMFETGAKAEQGQLSEFMKFKHNMPKGSVSTGDFSDYWGLKRNDARYSGLNVQDVIDTMKARNMTFNEVISKLRERK